MAFKLGPVKRHYIFTLCEVLESSIEQFSRNEVSNQLTNISVINHLGMDGNETIGFPL